MRWLIILVALIALCKSTLLNPRTRTSSFTTIYGAVRTTTFDLSPSATISIALASMTRSLEYTTTSLIDPSSTNVVANTAGTDADCIGWNCWNYGTKVGFIVASVFCALVFLSLLSCALRGHFSCRKFWKRSLDESQLPHSAVLARRIARNRRRNRRRQGKNPARDRISGNWKSESIPMSPISAPKPLPRIVREDSRHISSEPAVPHHLYDSEISSNDTGRRAVVNFGVHETSTDCDLPRAVTSGNTPRMTTYFDTRLSGVRKNSLYHDYVESQNIRRKNSRILRTRRSVILYLVPLGND